MADAAGFGSLPSMRILIALSAAAEVSAEALASIAGEDQLVLLGGAGVQVTRLELELRNALPDRDLLTVLTEVVVSADDPAFEVPSTPIGRTYTSEEALRLVNELGWSVAQSGDGFRRLVPAPEPHAIAELGSLRTLIDAGVVVICAAGAGDPMTIDAAGRMRPVEAVVDRELTAALLARRLDADLLLVLSDGPDLRAWSSDPDRALRSTSPAELRAMDCAAGSMSPGFEASCRFVEATDRRAAIGAPADLIGIASGTLGTQITALGERSSSAELAC